MLDYQRIVDDVRSALFNNGQDGDDFLQGAAADYSLAIDEANERLRQCAAFLRKGLRSEAIQLCEVEPNLLEVVGILDFPECDTWNELLALHGLASSSALMLEVAANLNEAYAVEQPLATLLQRHRLLAMSHGPIKLRLDTLRSLAAADPENSIWDQDVQTFEEERVKELQRDVPQAIARHDAAALNALALELEHSAWRIDRPDLLIQQIAVARSNEARQQGLDELKRTADFLNAMHAAFDVDGGRRAREQWESLLANWGQFADPSLPREVAAPLDWLREQDELAARAVRHETAVAGLEQAITARKPAENLHRLYREAKREGEIPENVEKRYRERLNAIDCAVRRKIQMSLAIFTLFIIAVGAIVTTVVLQHMQAGKVDRAVATLQQLVEDSNVDGARNFIDQLTAESPQIAADPRIQEISDWLSKRLKDEDAHRRAFATALELVQKSIADQLPDKDALARVKKLAASEDENTEIHKAEQQIAKLEQDVMSKADQDFVAQLKELKERVGPIEKEIDDKPDACIETLKNLSRELSNLQALNTHVSEAAKQPAELLRTRLTALDEEAHTVNERLNCEEAITAACGDNRAFREKLDEYAHRFPQARRSESLRAVASDESPLWDWVGQWNETVEAIGRRNCTKLDWKTAGDMIPKLRKLLDERPGHPDADAFKQRLLYLEAVVRRIDAEGNPIEAALKPVFTDPLLTGVWMLTDAAGQNYYLLEDPTAKFGSLYVLKPGRTYGFEYVTGFDLSKKRKSLDGGEIKREQPVAPQRATARELVSTLEAMNDEHWELSFCRMIETVLNDHASDPLLKHFLLRKIVDVGCQGSICLRKGFAGYVDALKNSRVPVSVNWVDPNNSDAAEQRPIAEAELGKLPSFNDAQNSAAKQWKALAGAIGTELTCVGWLRKNRTGAWQCLTNAACPQSGKLVIVRPAGANSEESKAAVFEAVGRLDKGKAVIGAIPGPALAEGRPVYVVNPAVK